ncbi:hypothetical protein BCR34DRAFT_362694 [Clohesyomyces aquaticus]|uniref:KANL3/Tex30 alpha/beta hydrolase-like domain-containing protein n=1 Tax=Clohesyomyces aquaticus TaxID=1231657 RepID=A0A1Y1ZIM5_9PLEO|nr:hypothetical protein BCR34DRAFT_362694 [Clohesyomyces aquaticus]
MPQKRGKDASTDGAPAPKRRSTRNATQKPQYKEDSGSDSPVPKPKTKKLSNAKPAKTTKAVELSGPEQSSLSPISISIEHESIKNPVDCELYQTSASPESGAPQTMVFTHGAGGGLSAPAVFNFCTGYSALHDILAFKGSINMNSRVKGFHACGDHLQKKSGSTSEWPSVFGGRSMGSRAAVIAATEIAASSDKKGHYDITLVLVSYPLIGPKNDMRDQILLDLPERIRVLFIIGEKDSMCALDQLGEVRGKMKAKSWLVVVKGADHGMHVKPAKAEKVLGEMTGNIAAKWVDRQTLGEDRDQKEIQIWWDDDGDGDGVKLGGWEGVAQ